MLFFICLLYVSKVINKYNNFILLFAFSSYRIGFYIQQLEIISGWGLRILSIFMEV